MNAYGIPQGPYRFPFDQKPYRLAPLATVLGVLLVILAAAIAAVVLAGPVWLEDSSLTQPSEVAVTVSVAALIVVVLTVILFVLWQYRHAKNARLLGHRGGLGPEWAVAGWIIPVANLLLPGLQLYATSRYSDPAVAAGSAGRGQPIVWLWVLVFDVGIVVTPGVRLGGLVLSAAAVLALVVVRQLSDLQDRAIAALISGASR